MLWVAVVLMGCQGQADVVSICETTDEETRDTGEFGVCHPCESDSDCVFTGNACTETVFCANRDDSIAVIEIGCSKALEYKWPDDEDCLCVDSECRY